MATGMQKLLRTLQGGTSESSANPKPSLLSAIGSAQKAGETPGQKAALALQEADAACPVDDGQVTGESADFTELRKLRRQKDPSHAPMGPLSVEEVIEKAKRKTKKAGKNETPEPISAPVPTKRGPGRPRSKSPASASSSRETAGSVDENLKALDDERNALLTLVQGYMQEFEEVRFHFRSVDWRLYDSEQLRKVLSVARQVVAKTYQQDMVWYAIKQTLTQGIGLAQWGIANNWDRIKGTPLEHPSRAIAQLGDFPQYITHVQEETEKRNPGHGFLTPELKELSILYGHYLPNHPLARLAAKLFQAAVDHLALKQGLDLGQKSKDFQAAAFKDRESLVKATQF